MNYGCYHDIDADCTNPKVKNGSLLKMGKINHRIYFKVDHHFNWFQKKMIKWCFGFTVEDYSEE